MATDLALSIVHRTGCVASCHAGCDTLVPLGVGPKRIPGRGPSVSTVWGPLPLRFGSSRAHARVLCVALRQRWRSRHPPALSLGSSSRSLPSHRWWCCWSTTRHGELCVPLARHTHARDSLPATPPVRTAHVSSRLATLRLWVCTVGTCSLPSSRSRRSWLSLRATGKTRWIGHGAHPTCLSLCVMA